MVSLWVSLAQAQNNLGLDWKHFLAAVWFWGSFVLGSQSPPGEGEALTSQPPSAHAETSRCETGPPPMVSSQPALI